MKKYRNIKTEIDGIKFDSLKESKRYSVLKLLERGKVISELQLQVAFELAPNVIIQGRKRTPIRYIADFVYMENGKQIIEDVKGVLTDIYKLKRHLMKLKGYDITEI